MYAVNFAALCAGTAFLIVAGTAHAQQDAATPSANTAAELLSKMHHMNLMQIQLAEIAMDKLPESPTRRFAARLKRDHSVADGKVTELASDLGLALTRIEPTQEQKNLRANLQAATGEEFAQTYVDAMHKTHTQALEMLSQAENRPEPEVAELARRLRPIVGQHVQLAENLQVDTQLAQVSNEERQ